MSDCARCGVAYTMNRRGSRGLYVIELEKSVNGIGPSYEIWVEVEPKKAAIERGDPRCIIYEGKMFLWSQTVFSREHSKDHDCNAVGKKSHLKLTDGFPLVLRWEDVQLISYSAYIGDHI